MQSDITAPQRSTENSANAVELKGSVFTLPILQIKSTSIDKIEIELQQRLSKALSFFTNAPVVIDLDAIAKNNQTFDFHAFLQILSQQQIIPVGVRNGSSQLNALAISSGLAVLKGGSLQNISDSENEKQETKVSPASDKEIENAALLNQKTKIITQPVRSGQQIYAKGGDLIVMAPVNAGAEIIADGNIHVYSAMRGRVLAGVRGDVSARIFCQSLEAELVAIAGNFRMFEENVSDEIKSKPVQIYLSGEQLIISPLNF